MRLYLVDSSTHSSLYTSLGWAARQFDPSHPIRYLLSFFYFRSEDIAALASNPQWDGLTLDLFADSGAFSAYTLGQPVDVGAYADWLHRWSHLFTAYANLDVKDDVDAGLRNLRYLEDRGLHPLPVFHGGEPMSVLDGFISDYPYIALGGLVFGKHGSEQQKLRFVIECFRHARGKSVYHGFGVTGNLVLRTLPWYSVDSTRWKSSVRFGQVRVFDSRKGKMVNAVVGDPTKSYRFGSVLRDHGVTPAQIADRSQYTWQMAQRAAALAHMKWEKYLTALHGHVAIPGRAS